MLHSSPPRFRSALRSLALIAVAGAGLAWARKRAKSKRASDANSS